MYLLVAKSVIDVCYLYAYFLHLPNPGNLISISPRLTLTNFIFFLIYSHSRTIWLSWTTLPFQKDWWLWDLESEAFWMGVAAKYIMERIIWGQHMG